MDSILPTDQSASGEFLSQLENAKKRISVCPFPPLPHPGTQISVASVGRSPQRGASKQVSSGTFEGPVLGSLPGKECISESYGSTEGYTLAARRKIAILLFKPDFGLQTSCPAGRRVQLQPSSGSASPGLHWEGNLLASLCLDIFA